PDGSTLWVREDSAIIRDDASVPVQQMGVYVDISPRKQAEARVQETEARYRSLIETLPAITYVEAADETSPIGYRGVYVNPQIEPILGYTAEQWMQDPALWRRIVHPDDLDRVIAEDARTTETGQPFNMQYRSFAADGRLVWLSNHEVIVPTEPGQPKVWQGVMFDITA